MWAYELSSDGLSKRHFQKLGYYVQTQAAGGIGGSLWSQCRSHAGVYVNGKQSGLFIVILSCRSRGQSAARPRFKGRLNSRPLLLRQFHRSLRRHFLSVSHSPAERESKYSLWLRTRLDKYSLFIASSWLAIVATLA